MKGESIKLHKDGEMGDPGFYACEQAWLRDSLCQLAMCVECYDTLKSEQKVSRSRRQTSKTTKSGVCASHSIFDLEKKIHPNGAYWLAPDWKNRASETRPVGCIHCCRPFVFLDSNKKQKKN